MSVLQHDNLKGGQSSPFEPLMNYGFGDYLTTVWQQVR